MKTLADVGISGMRVLVRGDLDVSLEGFDSVNGERESAKESLVGDIRLSRLKPTIDYIRARNPTRIIIAGKIGRPQGRHDPSLSTLRVKDALEKILGLEVGFADNLDNLPDVPVVLLENLHFWSEELQPSEDFAKKLARLADVFVNENFASAHRRESSIVFLPTLLPHAVGLHFAEEVEVLSDLLRKPARPFVAIVGGAKIETKVPVIENLAKIADFVLVGGAIAKELASSGWRLASSKVMIATLVDNTKDIDQGSIDKFGDIIKTAKTIVWNGPMGVFEQGFEKGSVAVANTIVESGAHSVVGGGETTAFLALKNLLSKFSFVSSGGGAMLEFLSGKKLPGIEALE